MTLILPGIHRDMPASTYHSDPAPIASLSSSIAKRLLVSPEHGAYEHPRLGGYGKPLKSTAVDIGSLCHAMVTGKDQGDIDLHNFTDWRKADARKAREESLHAGKTPILQREFDKAAAMYDTLMEQLTGMDQSLVGDLIADRGDYEISMLCEYAEGVFARCRFDFLGENGIAIDYKTLGNKDGASTESFTRHAVNMGYHLQHAHYMAVAGLTPGAPDVKQMIFLGQEVEYPHRAAIHVFAPSMIYCGQVLQKEAWARWQSGITTGKWPGYPVKPEPISAPGWLENQCVQLEEAQ